MASSRVVGDWIWKDLHAKTSANHESRMRITETDIFAAVPPFQCKSILQIMFHLRYCRTLSVIIQLSFCGHCNVVHWNYSPMPNETVEVGEGIETVSFPNFRSQELLSLSLSPH